MLRLSQAQTDTFMHKISVTLPTEKGVDLKTDFMARFKRYDTEALDELRELPGKEVMMRAFVGFDKVLDDDGQPLESNAVTIAAMLAVPQILHALIVGFWTASTDGTRQKI